MGEKQNEQIRIDDLVQFDRLEMDETMQRQEREEQFHLTGTSLIVREDQRLDLTSFQMLTNGTKP